MTTHLTWIRDSATQKSIAYLMHQREASDNDVKHSFLFQHEHAGQKNGQGVGFGANMSKSKRISQETFDAAVKENIDDFGLSVEEAIQDTIKEFQLQVSIVVQTCNRSSLMTL